MVQATMQHTSILDSVPALQAEGGPPEWIMLLPAGIIRTADGRGPYRVDDPARLIAASLQAAGGRLPIDENHATDLAAPRGGRSPARAWIGALESRSDGIFGRVTWSPSGAALLADHAYRYISPVITHREDGLITGILRASLTNRPNLRGMAALHQESNMEFLKQIAAILGLKEDASEEIALNAIKELKGAAPALQSALTPIAQAAGLKGDADATAILGAVKTLAAGASNDTAITALQAELSNVTVQLNDLKSSRAKEAATAFVDGEIAKGRVGVKPMRDHYISMHAVDPARVEKEIGAMPILGRPSGALSTPPEIKDGKVALNADQLVACKVLGLDPEAYAKTLAGETVANG